MSEICASFLCKYSNRKTRGMGQLYLVRSYETITNDRTLRLYAFISKHRLNTFLKHRNEEEGSTKVTQLNGMLVVWRLYSNKMNKAKQANEMK